MLDQRPYLLKDFVQGIRFLLRLFDLLVEYLLAVSEQRHQLLILSLKLLDLLKSSGGLPTISIASTPSGSRLV